MDLVFVLVLPAGLWVQAWYLLGYYPNPKALGIVAGAVAILLLGVVLFPVAPVVTPPDPNEFFVAVPVALSTFILLWAVYSALVSGVYLWGLDSRGLGFYSLFLWVASVVFAAYMFLGGELLNTGIVEPVSWLLGVVGILLAIPAALLFFYLTLQPGEPRSSPMRTVTGWFYLVFSVAIGVLGALMVLGLDPSL
jgi:hypothetical protein